VIVQEGAPGLRRRPAATHHVFTDAALPDVDTEFEQLAVDGGAPQPGFSRHILRIRPRISWEIAGRPGWPRRTLQVQNRRKPARCQATTVSGLTMARAERQSRHRRDSPTHKRRSAGSISGVFSRTAAAHPPGGAEPGSLAQASPENGTLKTECQAVS